MTAAPDDRRRELAQIHIAKKDLCLDEETYRAMLWAIGRVHSAGALGAAGRRQVLEHLKSRGFKARKSIRKDSFNTRSEWAWVNNAAPDRQAMLRKIAVMIKADNREKAYVDGIAQHMFHVERVEFCPPDQLHRIITALVFDQRRRERAA